MSDHTRDILLIEDNPGDVRLILEALSESGNGSKLHTCRDGVEALDFLRRKGDFRSSPRPDLILLDLEMPRMTGRELLARIKRDEQLKAIPVVVLTSSAAEGDVAEAYRLHANCYIKKPVELERFFRVIRSIEEFWLQVVQLPAE